MPKLSTLITWALYFVPVYLFVVAPLLQILLPIDSTKSTRTPATWELSDVLDDWDDTTPALNLTDDSFISPEDGVPPNCPGEAPGYKVHLLTRAPLILYIENFLSSDEADHLVDIRYGVPTAHIALHPAK